MRLANPSRNEDHDSVVLKLAVVTENFVGSYDP